jgi:hypothetical protein
MPTTSVTSERRGYLDAGRACVRGGASPEERAPVPLAAAPSFGPETAGRRHSACGGRK